MFWELLEEYKSTEDSILLKANVHHNILRKVHIFSAIGDFSTNSKKLIYEASQEAYVQFLNSKAVQPQFQRHLDSLFPRDLAFFSKNIRLKS